MSCCFRSPQRLHDCYATGECELQDLAHLLTVFKTARFHGSATSTTLTRIPTRISTSI